jgi:hypothetical protein
MSTKQVALWSLSTGSYLAVDYFFDFIIYFWAIAQFGPFIGGGSVLIVGIVIDLVVLHLYNRGQYDLFGFEELKKLRDYSGSDSWRIKIAKILKEANLLTVIALAFYSNPCLATIYMRPSDVKRRPMNLHDWMVFLVSFFVDVVWIVIVYGFVQLVPLVEQLLLWSKSIV